MRGRGGRRARDCSRGRVFRASRPRYVRGSEALAGARRAAEKLVPDIPRPSTSCARGSLQAPAGRPRARTLLAELRAAIPSRRAASRRRRGAAVTPAPAPTRWSAERAPCRRGDGTTRARVRGGLSATVAGRLLGLADALVAGDCARRWAQGAPYAACARPATALGRSCPEHRWIKKRTSATRRVPRRWPRARSPATSRAAAARILCSSRRRDTDPSARRRSPGRAFLARPRDGDPTSSLPLGEWGGRVRWGASRGAATSTREAHSAVSRSLDTMVPSGEMCAPAMRRRATRLRMVPPRQYIRNTLSYF